MFYRGPGSGSPASLFQGHFALSRPPLFTAIRSRGSHMLCPPPGEGNLPQTANHTCRCVEMRKFAWIFVAYGSSVHLQSFNNVLSKKSRELSPQTNCFPYFHARGRLTLLAWSTHKHTSARRFATVSPLHGAQSRGLFRPGRHLHSGRVPYALLTNNAWTCATIVFVSDCARVSCVCVQAYAK